LQQEIAIANSGRLSVEQVPAARGHEDWGAKPPLLQRSRSSATCVQWHPPPKLVGPSGAGLSDCYKRKILK